jgi:hypothetical protein
MIIIDSELLSLIDNDQPEGATEPHQAYYNVKRR